ncbi:MAG: hypothetical protein WC426_13565 [Sulfuriferula sp.]
MDNTRNRPEQQFAADVRTLLKDIEDFKQFQRSGQDSIRMYRIFSGVVDKTLTGVTFNNKRFRLKFTPDEGKQRGLVYKMEYTYTEASGGGISSVQVEQERENVDNDDGSQTWLFVVSGSDFFPNPLVQMKFYFWASGTGTFSITDL